MIQKYLLSSVVIIALIQPVYATEQTQDTKPGWSGEAEVGLLVTSGNTNTSTQNAKLGVQYLTGPWVHKFRAEYLNAEENGVVNAQRGVADFRSTYNLNVRDYLFGAVRYENDRFAGYNSRWTEVGGYGWNLYNLEKFLWKAETGAGARQTRYTDNTDTNEGIVRVATELVWKITKTSSLKEDLFVEAGSDNTLTQSTTSLKVKINASLALKLSYFVQNNSDVPPGIEHTDTTTSLTLVYDM